MQIGEVAHEEEHHGIGMIKSEVIENTTDSNKTTKMSQKRISDDTGTEGLDKRPKLTTVGPSATYHILIPCSVVGLILGTSSKTLEAKKKEFKLRFAKMMMHIRCPNGNVPDTKEQVMRVHGAVNDVCDFIAHLHEIYDTSRGSQSLRNYHDALSQSFDRADEVRFMIPPVCARLIVGPAGSNIKRMSIESQCIIEVMPRFSRQEAGQFQNMERIVVVSGKGNRRALIKGCEQVMSTLATDEQNLEQNVPLVPYMEWLTQQRRNRAPPAGAVNQGPNVNQGPHGNQGPPVNHGQDQFVQPHQLGQQIMAPAATSFERPTPVINERVYEQQQLLMQQREVIMREQQEEDARQARSSKSKMPVFTAELDMRKDMNVLDNMLTDDQVKAIAQSGQTPFAGALLTAVRHLQLGPAAARDAQTILTTHMEVMASYNLTGVALAFTAAIGNAPAMQADDSASVSVLARATNPVPEPAATPAKPSLLQRDVPLKRSPLVSDEQVKRSDLRNKVDALQSMLARTPSTTTSLPQDSITPSPSPTSVQSYADQFMHIVDTGDARTLTIEMPTMVAHVVLQPGGQCHKSIVEVTGCTVEMSAGDMPDVNRIVIAGSPDALSGARYMLRAAVVAEIRKRMNASLAAGGSGI